MADRPIIFSAPMIRALLEGRKSQTRRVLNPQPYGFAANLWIDDKHSGACRLDDWAEGRAGCLPYAPGDRLWVREACRAEELSQPPGERPATKAEREKLGRNRVPVMSELDGADGVRYLADDSWRIIENNLAASDRWIDLFHYRWRGKSGIGNNVPSIHMPRWASRLTLIVTDVRVQRVQEISEADAMAEGIERRDAGGFLDASLPPRDAKTCGYFFVTAKAAFSDLWNSIHGPDAWDRNDWVAATSFTVHRCNIDQMGVW